MELLTGLPPIGINSGGWAELWGVEEIGAALCTALGR